MVVLASNIEFRCPNIESGFGIRWLNIEYSDKLARFDIGASNIESIWCNIGAYIIGFKAVPPSKSNFIW